MDYICWNISLLTNHIVGLWSSHAAPNVAYEVEFCSFVGSESCNGN